MKRNIDFLILWHAWQDVEVSQYVIWVNVVEVILVPGMSLCIPVDPEGREDKNSNESVWLPLAMLLTVYVKHWLIMCSVLKKDLLIQKLSTSCTVFILNPLIAKKNCIRKCRLFMSSAEYSCKLFKLIFAYRQTVWTQIRLEQSDLGPHCLQKWLLKVTGRRQSRRQ